MTNIQNHVENYLNYCRFQKRLDEKTLRAYRIDLNQFIIIVEKYDLRCITPDTIENYILQLHSNYQTKTIKRKIASIKALFHFFEYKGIIETNPFSKLQIKFREPTILPKTIPLYVVKCFLTTIYHHQQSAATLCQKKNRLRDIAIAELLFSTGIRISELCSLKDTDVDLSEKSILVYGKGAKERSLPIGSADVVLALQKYRDAFSTSIQKSNCFYINLNGTPVSDQSIRRMIRKYCTLAAIDLHITPHMFRHTFATSLLEADVDIRYIQNMLGHSSINTTQIYTHVSQSKQRDILSTKHPRNQFDI